MVLYFCTDPWAFDHVAQFGESEANVHDMNFHGT